MSDKEKDNKEDQGYYIFSPDELLENEEPLYLTFGSEVIDTKKNKSTTEQSTFDYQEKEIIDEIKEDKSKETFTQGEQAISKLEEPEKIQNQEIGGNIPEITEISITPEKEGRSILKNIFQNISWKIVGISISLVVLIFVSYYGYLFFQKKEAVQLSQEESEKEISLDLPVEVEKATNTQENQMTTSTVTSSEVAFATSTTSTQLQLDNNQTTNTQEFAGIEPINTTSEATTSEQQSITENLKATSSEKQINQETGQKEQVSTLEQDKVEEKEEIKQEEISEESDKIEETKSSVTGELPETKQQNYSYGQVISFPDLNEHIIIVQGLNIDDFSKAVAKLASYQGVRDSLEWVRFIYQDKDISGNLVKEYFLQPSFADKEQINRFWQSLGSEYAVLFYYTYTKKYPILIFKTKDSVFARTFLSLWEKESLIQDSEPMYFTLDRGWAINNYFQKLTYQNVPYYMVKFNRNYFKLIWSVYQDLIIFSTSQSGFEKLIDYLHSR